MKNKKIHYADFCGGNGGILKKIEKQSLREELGGVISKYVAAFEEKHDCYLEFWVADDKTGIACFGDYFFSLSDIVYDVDNNCPKYFIFDWQNHQIENGSKVNFKSYLMGIR